MMVERRRFTRITPKGTTRLHIANTTRRARLVDLGQGGMLVALKSPLAAELLARDLEIEMRFDDPLAEWVWTRGSITRIEGDSAAIALVDAPVVLTGLIALMAAAATVRTVVVIDRDRRRRARIASELGMLGCTVVETATPLEMIVRLGEASFEPDLVVIADSTTVGPELWAFVAKYHPHAAIVSSNPGDDGNERAAAARWLTSVVSPLSS